MTIKNQRISISSWVATEYQSHKKTAGGFLQLQDFPSWPMGIKHPFASRIQRNRT